MATSSLDSTFGQWLLALFLQSILYGTGVLQVYLYFFWYHKDHWGIKSAVILITVFETFEIATFFSATYSYLIDGFGDKENLTVYNWQTMASLAGVYASTFVAQMYFASQIYRLHSKNKVIPVVINLLALGSLGAGIAQIIRDLNATGFTNLHETTVTRALQASFALACDVLITVALCFRLNKQRTGLQSTNTLLNWLILTAINRGVLTMVSAALNLILFFAKPNTFYFMVWILLGGKFYMNSMLAILNTRQYAVGLHGSAVIDHISMGAISTRNNNVELNVQVTTSVVCDDDTQDGKFAV